MDGGKIEGSHIIGKEICHQKRNDCYQRKSFSSVGKSKKTYNAEVVNDGSGFDVPQQATGIAAGEDEPLTLKLVDPAPEETQQSPHVVARLEDKVTV